MHPLTRILSAAALCATLSQPAFADAALERIFDGEQLSNVEAGTALAFTHARTTVAPDKVPAIEDRDIFVKVGETGEDGMRPVVVTVAEGGREAEMDPFRDDSGNPVLLIFLESVAKAVADSTGGSPFYIKNRIKDSFSRGTKVSKVDLVRDGKPVEAVRIVYRPFEEEENRARLQNFDNFELVFILSRAVPGGIVEMRASDDPDAEEGFREYVVLDGVAEAQE